MRMIKSIVAMVVLTASVGQAGDSAPILLDTVTTSTSPTVNSLDISWNAAWIGGDENATVVIADNGTEVRRAADAGMFSHALTGIWRHDLTYTTYIGGVVQDEVYTTTVYTVQAQFKYDVIDGRAVISDTMQTSGDVTIPSVIDGYSVNGIADGAFSGLSGLTSVTLPDGVTSIGNSAFRDCSGLTSVTLPNGVTSIESYAFYGCSGLMSVTIPDSVTSIGSYAFFGCSGLMSVTIPDSVTSIGSYAFYGCSGLMSVTIPSRWALSSMFPQSYSCITNVTIPSGSTGIVNQAFKGCTALTSISIPDSVTGIGDEAFYNCTSLEHLAMPEGVTSYGVNCFEGCPAYTLNLYRAVFGGGVGSGSASVVTTIVQNVEVPYALTNAVADHAIASVTVDADCAIDSFVLKDGKVYDSVLYISNTVDHAVTLTLPSGYVYKAIKGARPLEIPANSQSILSITRVANNVFLVSREDLETIQ